MAHNAVSQIDVGGASVLVLGAGPIGLFTVAISKAFGTDINPFMPTVSPVLLMLFVRRWTVLYVCRIPGINGLTIYRPWTQICDKNNELFEIAPKNVFHW